jgi:hypothetical protein
MERARDGAANGLALDQLITGSGWHESGLQRMLSACTAARLWCMRPGASCFDPIVSVHTGWAGPAAGRDGRGAAAAAEPWVRVSARAGAVWWPICYARLPFRAIDEQWRIWHAFGATGGCVFSCMRLNPGLHPYRSTRPALSQAFYVPPQSGGGPGEHQGTSLEGPLMREAIGAIAYVCLVFMPTAQNLMLIASSVLNSLLLLTLISWQHLSVSVEHVTHSPESTWCTPRPTATPRGADDDGHAPPPSPAMVLPAAASPQLGLSAPAVAEHFYSASEPRLKRIWRHPPHNSYKEQHDARWTFLSERQLARGLVNPGDPQRLRCLAEKLLAGHLTRLSVLGGSVSFGTTFTTGRSRALYHWKVYQYLNASFPLAAHEHFQGAVPASGPSYMEHCVAWHLPSNGADLILLEYAVNFDAMPDDAQSFERLLRRLLRLPSQPAIVIVNTMEIVPKIGHLPFEYGSYDPTNPATVIASLISSDEL